MGNPFERTMKWPSTKHRRPGAEIMDDFDMGGEVLTEALDKIAKINRLLGGNALTVSAVSQIVSSLRQNDSIAITDLGCGNGDMLRALSELSKSKKVRFELKGIDANGFTIAYATRLSAAYPDIDFVRADILDDDFRLGRCDIVLLTLTLHHFTDDQIVRLLKMAKECGAKAVIVNDLHRSRLAYILFHWMSRIVRLGKMNSHDGKLSILKGFKRKELRKLASRLEFKKQTIRWKWAFRYQWVLSDI